MITIDVFERWINKMPTEDLTTLLKYVSDELYEREHATESTTINN